MKGLLSVAIILLGALILFGQTVYIVSEPEQVVITRFGAPIGDAISEPGLHFKMPFTDKVNRFDKRWLEWDGDRNQIPTKDKKYIFIDTFARWRISDPLKYLQAVANERGAQSRLDDIIDGKTRTVIASYDLIEVVRSSNRPFEVSEELKELAPPQVHKVSAGRTQLEQEILEMAAEVTPDYGIELVDVRFKRTEYIDAVRAEVYNRMVSERRRIAERYRSEGQGKSAEIRGEMEKELREIRSESFRKAEEIRGKADAEATRIYAAAYNRDPEFYAFLKTLETWKDTLDSDTRMLLTTDAEFLRYLKKAR